MLRHTFMPLLAIALIALATSANAATRTWVGGNDPWDTDIFNWSGFDEPDPNDDVVFNTNNSVDMAMDNEILSLTLSSSISLDTSTFLLDVNGDIVLSDAGTRLRAGQNDLLGLPGSSLNAYNITVNNGASFQNANSTTFINPVGSGLFDINSGGTLYGNGTIINADGFASQTVVFENDGVIRPGNVADLIIFFGAPTARTLTLSAADTDAQIDLDGTGGNGAVDVTRNQTLDINLALSDNFDGTIDLAHNATLDIEEAWDFSGTMNVDNGFIPGQALPFFIPAIPADVAFLQGGEITMTGSATTINLLDSDDTLQFDAQFTATDGTISNNGTIVFNEDATIDSGVDFQMLGNNASLTVGAGATVTVNDDDFNVDAGGSTANIVTVNSGGRLNINLGAGAEEKLDGVINLNGGKLDISTASNTWTTDRELNLAHVAGTGASVSGERMIVGDDSGTNDADVHVTGAGASFLFAPVTFNSDADVDIAAGATLQTSSVTFESVNGVSNAQFTGAGKWRLAGTTTVNEETTIDMVGGTVDLDNSDSFFGAANDTFVNAPLTINAATMQSYGDSSVNIFPNPPSITELNVDNEGVETGVLTVNLDDPNDEWTINSIGVVNLVNGNGAQTLLAGSDVNVEGTVNVAGDVRTAARMDISGTVNINTAGQFLRLSGGNNTNDPNTIAGGTISGPGAIGADSGTALQGHGVINAPIDFNGSSNLIAEGGTLNVNGGITDVGTLGTSGAASVLNVAIGWNTSVTQAVILDGGELTGGNITNDGANGIRGNGLVTAAIRNNTIVHASGGNLILDNAANDWDGPGNAGILRASSTTLELRDNASFLFNGTVEATSGTVFASGFELEFDPGSTLRLAKGIYSSDTATDFGGNIEVIAGAPSIIQVTASSTFENTSSTVLNDTLRLEDGHSFVESGATFAGGGVLHNAGSHVLTLEDGANVGVLVENEGLLTLGASPGQATVLDYQQDAIGTLEIELEGTGLNDYDRLTATGLMQLDGLLELSLIGGFNPALSDTFTILSAAVGVNGAFNAFDFSAAMLDPGLMWDVIYNPTNVELEVVSVPSFTADFDNDGDVDGDDLAQWEGDFGGPGSDADSDGDSDGFDFLVWQQQHGSGVPLVAALSASAVPEPSTLLLAGLAACFGLLVPRQKK